MHLLMGGSQAESNLLNRLNLLKFAWSPFLFSWASLTAEPNTLSTCSPVCALVSWYREPIISATASASDTETNLMDPLLQIQNKCVNITIGMTTCRIILIKDLYYKLWSLQISWLSMTFSIFPWPEVLQTLSKIFKSTLVFTWSVIQTAPQGQGVKLTFFTSSHLTPKYFNVAASSKKLVAWDTKNVMKNKPAKQRGH